MDSGSSTLLVWVLLWATSYMALKAVTAEWGQEQASALLLRRQLCPQAVRSSRPDGTVADRDAGSHGKSQ